MKANRFALAIAMFLVVPPAGAQIDTAILRPVGYHPSNIAYFNTPYFANALFQGGEWYSFSGFDFGTPLDFNALPAQFINGYPQFLNSGQKLRALLFGLNINNTDIRPPGWPLRDTLARGRVIVTWQGNADIRLRNCPFVAGGSSGGEFDNLNNGRRVYMCSGNQLMQSLEVHEIVTPITEIRVWFPAPDDPATQAKENETSSLEGQLFHPLLLQRIADADWGFIRFMDWGATNASPQQDWADRRRPAHIFMNGIINSRQPSATAEGNRETGVAYEHMVALCNATGRNLWINVPHLSTSDFMTKLAQLIRFGSDGVNPYTAPEANPVFPPLDTNLKVFVEFSNEIWSSGFAFPQGNWAEEQATGLGITKAQFNARRFCDTWRVFQQVFGGTSRLVRVAATFTANETYTTEFLQEMANYGPTLAPAVRPDVLAVTTYFGNDIQGFVQAQGYTTGKLFDDPYWTGSLFQTHLQTAFDEWKRRILAGDAAAGSGPDATGIGGGFSASLRTLPQTIFGFPLPIIAYEGGPSLFTDAIDSGGSLDDDGVTIFIEAMNRDPRIADVYRMHLETAKSKGLWTHNPYTDTSTWSRFGQWGHLETLDQPPASAPKYSLMLEHFSTFSTLRHIDDALGAVPQFATAASLPAGIAGQPYTTDITTSGGDGARTVTVVGSLLGPGLSIAAGPAVGTLRVSGTPATSRKNFIFARVNDADGDPAWRTFTLETFGGPGTLIQSDFRGTSPGQNLPWTTTFVLSPRVTWSGWNAGAGVTPQSGDNALVFSVSAPSAANETLAQSMTDNEFLTATITPAQGAMDLRGGKIRFSTRRIGFHGPLGYALFTSISGFTEAGALYVSSEVTKDNFDEVEHVVTIPSTAAYSAVNAAFEVRIYAFGAQFDGHKTSLTGFKLSEFTPTPLIVVGAAASRSGGGTPSTVTLATVADDEDPAGTLTVTATSVPSGITIASIANNNGTITATVGASCSATIGASTIALQVANSTGAATTGNWTVNVSANTVPTLGNYGDITIPAGGSTTVTPSAPPADNGTATVTPTASAGFTGTVTANSTTGVVSISNANAGTHTITVAAKDNCNASATSKTFTLTVGAAAPTISGFSPTGGVAGDVITITGTNFTGATAARFNGTAATIFTVNSSTVITATVPAGATTGPISVTTPSGTAASQATFTIQPPPTVTSITPNTGPLAGGTSVTITGTNFLTGATVTFGSAAATNVTVANATTITAATPAAASSGTVDVIVTNPTSQSGRLSGGFNYTNGTNPPGDANGDGTVTVSDIFYLINNLFTGGPAPVGPADANGDGTVGVSDIFYLINFLFANGPAPQAIAPAAAELSRPVRMSFSHVAKAHTSLDPRSAHAFFPNHFDKRDGGGVSGWS